MVIIGIDFLTICDVNLLMYFSQMISAQICSSTEIQHFFSLLTWISQFSDFLNNIALTFTSL